MYGADSQARQGPVVAVIGGGASGALVTVHLLRYAAAEQAPLRVALIDRDGRYGLGQAYGTTHPAHLLNSPAGQMSALAGDPDHLVRWAAAAGFSYYRFLPRRDYGRYLCETLADAERAAAGVASVSYLCSHAVAIRRITGARPLRVHLAADGRIDADFAVLATGNPPPSPPCPIAGDARYIADPWAPGALAPVGDGRPVVIAGTGLTMLDLAIAVIGANPLATVTAVSRHGLLPLAHREEPPPAGPNWLPAFTDPHGPVRLTRLLRYVREAVAEPGADWEGVVDSLRPYVPRLWQRLPLADKRVFLRDVARYWEIHRHRVPPATAATIAGLRAAGRLSVVTGRVAAAVPCQDGLRVHIDHDGPSTELSAGWLINATGPGRDITATGEPLWCDLLGHGLARPDPLRLGVDADATGAVVDAGGRPSRDLFALGPPLRGGRYETTAIPEIREQAAALARRVIAVSQGRLRSGSAA